MPEAERESDHARELEEHAKLALEWQVLLVALAERAVSAPAQERLLNLAPAATRDEAHARAARVRSLLTLAEHGVELPRSAFPDVRETLARVRLSAGVSGLELVELRKLIEQAAALRHTATERADLDAGLEAWLGSDPKLERLGARLGSALERDGTVSDSASPALAAARARARDCREELKRRLGELSHRYADVLSGQYYTERDGRYVLPVRADAHYRVDGIVLGSSGSGSTLFVEPTELLTLGNKLRVREAEVERETARVLEELSGAVRAQLPSAEQAFEVCIVADVTAALSSYAVATRSVPLDVGEEPRFDVRAMRHPLLALKEPAVVSNDIVLRSGQALVVSGPNAGGKTVALKCLGLFVWMARAGVPISAAESSYVGWFDAVLADIGDEQSVVRSLSTFSAHVRHLSSILELARPHVLVLLDEVAAGTDPEEGAALAAAVLEELSARGAAVAVTTHYERLKELAAQPGALGNASVGFDFTRMAPTFRLTLGIPGASSALQVAARHGMPAGVLARAELLLPRASLERERLVLELSAERTKLVSEREAFAHEREAERERSRNADAEREALAAAERAGFEREARQLASDVQKARAELRSARESLRAEQLTQAEHKAAEARINQVAALVAIGGRFAQPTSPGEPVASGQPLPELQAGTRVRLRSTGAIGTVIEPPQRGEVLVRVGALRLRQKLSELQQAPPQSKERAASPRPLKSVSVRAAAQRTRDNTLDLRGVRVEDAALQLDAFVDRLLGAGQSAGFVLHGHGTGALRSAVREHLRLCSYVEQPRAAEADDGGEALTVFWVR